MIKIFKSKELECLYVDNNSEDLLITFNERGTVADGKTIWGGRLAEKLGLSVLGFVSTSPNWFPEESVRKAVDEFHKLNLEHKNVVGYGFSQGAYGAIKFSRLLKTKATIAFCPQWSIDPDYIQDGRYNYYFKAGISGGTPIYKEDVGGVISTFFDKDDALDLDHAKRIEDLGANSFIVRHTLHETVRGIASSEMFFQLYKACRDDDKAKVRAIIPLIRRKSPNRVSAIVYKLLQNKPNLAYRIIKKRSEQITDRMMPRICFRMGLRGMYAESIFYLKNFFENNPDNIEGIAIYAHNLMKIGRLDEAAPLTERGLALNPNHKDLLKIRDRVHLSK